jgi:hypothetical protein
MDKQINKAFGKKIYLLGIDQEGTKYWLEEPKWDCGWYWGFGYIESYTNNDNPSLSRDINSHQHWEGTLQELNIPMMLVGYKGVSYINWNKEVLERKEYVHNPYDNPYLVEKTFNEKEGWELGELFAQFYFLKQAAEMFNRGKAYISNTIIPLWKDDNKVKEINEIIIPNVTKRILEILTPKSE